MDDETRRLLAEMMSQMAAMQESIHGFREEVNSRFDKLEALHDLNMGAHANTATTVGAIWAHLNESDPCRLVEQQVARLDRRVTKLEAKLG